MLANKCPYVDGSVVYQARALYSLIYNDLRMWNDAGCGGGTREMLDRKTSPNPSQGGGIGSASNQQYSLSPNPSNGNITLKQLVPDANPVDAVIMNATGEEVYKNTLQFTGGTSQISIDNMPPGLYLIKLTDNKSQTFTMKFVIAK